MCYGLIKFSYFSVYYEWHSTINLALVIKLKHELGNFQGFLVLTKTTLPATVTVMVTRPTPGYATAICISSMQQLLLS